MSKIAFLYAGQGSQHTGMGKDLYKIYPEFKSVFDRCRLDFDLKKVCFDNPENVLFKTEYTQPCMVAFACGVTEILKSKKIYPDYVCGLSLGEYSALYAANVWDFSDTMKVISYRGRVMAEASAGIEAGMTAITGTTPSVVEEACKKAIHQGIVSVCNLNCPGQIVIGGEKKAVDVAVQYAKRNGARRCVPLAVSGPFHTAFMKLAGDKLRLKLKEVNFNEPSCEVLFNYSGGPKGSETIPDLLVRQIQSTVRMQDCIELLINEQVKTFIEIGPGKVLSGFVKKCLRNMGLEEKNYNIFTVENTEDLAGFNADRWK